MATARNARLRAQGPGPGRSIDPGFTSSAPGAPRPDGRGRRGRVNPQGQGMMNPPGQGNGRPQAPRQGARPGVGNAGLGGQALAGPGGRQLQARVQSGAITGAQAQRTMQQRETLAKALGPNWRDKLQVGGKSFAQVNAGLKRNPGNPKLAALRKKLTANRSTLLEQAREKGNKKPAAPAETLGE
jgi:hypothetical protein